MSFWDSCSKGYCFGSKRFIEARIIRIPIKEIANEIFFIGY